ncbi:MAG TPA: hypothetical protein VMX96_09750 [Dehalococcoidia bacterium]|nr:hypothetical protein [Dehalococcoidia bacterium]
MEEKLKTGRDYRAEMARNYLLLYEVAAAIGVHPVRLGRMLREKEPITGSVRKKLDAFLEKKEIDKNVG